MALLIQRTFFRDPVNELYSVYDSELPADFYTRFGDSESPFKGIDYLSLRNDSEWFDSDSEGNFYYSVIDSEIIPITNAQFNTPSFINNPNIKRYILRRELNDDRTFKLSITDRKQELVFLQEEDFQKAMRDDDSLSWTEERLDRIYTNFEAYERKWNQINTVRETDSEGWEVVGFSSSHQTFRSNPRYFRIATGETNVPIFSKVKTPLNESSYEGDGLWHRSYIPELNRGIVEPNVVERDLQLIRNDSDLSRNYWDPRVYSEKYRGK